MNKRTKIVMIVTIAASLVAMRVAAPVTIEYYLNEHLLTRLGDYRGEVADVDLALWRGAVRIEDLRVEKTRGKEWVDFAVVPAAEVFISRRALLSGAVRLEVFFDRPEINFVDADNPEDRQTGKGFNWRVIPEDMLKFSLERVEVREGTFAFRNFTSDPQVNLRVTNINAVATNLTNIENLDGTNVGTAEVTADVFGDSPLFATAEFDPFNLRSFIFAGEIEVSDLKHLNDFAQAYANLDFKSGQGALTMELEAVEGRLTGYAKPAFEDVEIVDWEQDVERQGDNPLRVLWEGAAGLISAIFSNPKEDRLATRIEISGEIPDEPELNIWGAVFGIVRNAFAEAINAGFDDITPLDVPENEAEDNGEEDSDAEDKEDH